MRIFGAMQNRFPIFAPFPARIPATGILPLHDKPCKIRENSHKYCDITCNNSPYCNEYRYKSMMQNGHINSPSLDLACPQAGAENEKYVHMLRDRGVDKIKYAHEGIMIILRIATHIYCHLILMLK